MTAFDALEVAYSLYISLRACHDAGVVHLDVQPQNCVKWENGYALIDFGSSKLLNDRVYTQGNNGFVGTNHFTSLRVHALDFVWRPEQEYLSRDDFESLFFVPYELLVPLARTSMQGSHATFLQNQKIAFDTGGTRFINRGIEANHIE